MNFVSYDAPIDLSNCDREPIHIPGQVQAHGALLALDRATLTVTQVSDNTAQYLGLAPAALLGAPLASLLDPLDLAAVQRAVTGGSDHAPAHAFCGRVGEGAGLDVIAHRDGPVVIVEVEPAHRSDLVAPDFYDFASRTIASLQGAPSTLAYCQMLTEAIHGLTGYDRVMVYRFDDDWSGHVVAETMSPGKGLSPFLDLHYPASDIPAQARALFLKNTVRMLPDALYTPARLVPELNPTTGAPLDLSHGFLRGASQMYTEYLVNMGVRASLTLALTDRDRLWGLVACHHYDVRRVSYGVRGVGSLLGRVASLQITDKVHADEAEYRGRIQGAHAAIVEALAAGGDVAVTLARAAGTLRGFVASRGVAVVTRGGVSVEGAAPPEVHLRRLASLWSGTARGEVVATERLAELYPEARAFIDVACGALAVPLSSEGEYAMWFRPEVTRTVKWAGDPHKPVTVGPMGDRLTPRKSFELWVETVKDASAPWTRLEVDAAKRLRTSITELLLRRSQELERLNTELARSNQELDAFAYAASHDLKEPLRGIYNYAEFLRRDAGPRLEGDDLKKLDGIVRLSHRMQGLISSLLEYSRLGRGEARLESVELGALLAGVVESFATQAQEKRARLTVSPRMPTVRGVPRFFEQVFANLVSNALKYNDKAEPEVEVGVVPAGSAAFPRRALGAPYAYFVRDNGIGIAERHYETVFRIFKRLHPADRYGGGAGAGMTIVKKLVERMGGEVWIESEVGKGSTVWFTAPGEPEVGP